MDVAAAYGTSAMPVREALSRLVAERALQTAPNRSIIVPVLTPARLDDLRQVRKIVEGAAVTRACARITSKGIAEMESILAKQMPLEGKSLIAEAVEANALFHFTLYRWSGSAVLLPVIESLWLQFGPYLRHATALNDRTPGRGLRYHLAIISALKARDCGKAVAALEADVDISFDLTALHPIKSSRD